MLAFLYQRLDFIFFVYAALFLLISKKSFINYKLEKENKFWLFMSLFSALYATKYILDATSLGGYRTGIIFDILTATCFLVLIEYLVSSTKFFYSSRFLRLTTLWIALLLVVSRILIGEAATDLVTRLLCLISGFGVGIKILQMAGTDKVEKGFKKLLYIIAAFLVAFILLQFVVLRTDVYITWVYKSRLGLVTTFLELLFAAGLLSMNSALAQLGEDPVSGGDVRLVIQGGTVGTAGVIIGRRLHHGG